MVPPSAPPPFCSPFLCLLLFQEESHKYKSGECGALLRCYVCLISLCGERSVAGAND